MTTAALIVLGVVIVVLIIAAIATLSADVVRGAIGGRRTLERARRLLVVSTDSATNRVALNWVEHHRANHPDSECVVMQAEGKDDFEIYLDFQRAVDRERPDGVVWALHSEDRKHAEEGPYAMAKRELELPLDAIYAPAASAASPEHAA